MIRLSIYFFISILGTVFTASYGQEIGLDSYKDEVKSAMMGSIETLNNKLSSELDSIREYHHSDVENTAEDLLIYKRLKGISTVIPLEYNAQVKAYIDKYVSKNYRPYMSRLRGLSQHYFSIYEKIFEQNGIPDEVKYLSLVESSLDPHLVSSSGAVGPWQFIYGTAKLYDLDMDSYVDERKDAYAASYAVTQYLNESYNQFNDWLLALASYNCGRGCVQRAIQRSGLTNPNFWELSPYLPTETRNYIPKYIAMTYAMEMADFYDILPMETEVSAPHVALMLNKVVDLKKVAAALDISLDQLKYFNPSYKRNVVNGSEDHPKRLLVPQVVDIDEGKLYTALHQSEVNSEEIKLVAQSSADIKNYKVGRGETLTSVAAKFGVTVQNLRAWNGLTAKSTVAGRDLIVSKPLDSRLANQAQRKSSPVYYTVKSGDSLDRIANRHKGLSVSKLKADNNLKSNLIKPGMKLKINKG